MSSKFNYSPKSVSKEVMHKTYNIPPIPMNNDEFNGDIGDIKQEKPPFHTPFEENILKSSGVITTPSIQFRENISSNKSIQEEIKGLVTQDSEVKNVHVNIISSGGSSEVEMNTDQMIPVISPSPLKRPPKAVEMPLSEIVGAGDSNVSEPVTEEANNDDEDDEEDVKNEDSLNQDSTVAVEVQDEPKPKKAKPDYSEFHKSEDMNKDSFDLMVGIIDDAARMELAPIKASMVLISMIEDWLKTWSENPNANVFLHTNIIKEITNTLDKVRRYDSSVGDAILTVQNVFDSIKKSPEMYIVIK